MVACQRLSSLIGHKANVNVVRFTNDGQYCVSGSDDRTVRLWNPHRKSVTVGGQRESALLIKTYSGVHGYGVLDVAVAPNNESFASAGHDKSIFLWDVPTGSITRKIDAHTQRINALALNVDATVLASASYDQKVHLWDLRTKNRSPLQILSDCKDSATSVAISQEAIVVGCVDGMLRTYDLRKGLLHTDTLVDPVVSVRLSYGGNSVASLCLGKGKGGGNIYRYELGSPSLSKVWRKSGNSAFKSECCFSSEGNVVISGDESGHLKWWGDDEDAGYHVGSMIGEQSQAHSAAISSLSHHPHDTLLLSAAYEEEMYLWQIDYS